MTSIRGIVLVAGAAVSLAVVNACQTGNAQQRDTARARKGVQPKTQMASLSGNTPAESAAALPAGALSAQGTGEWWMPGRDYSGSRYSTLNDINTSNVANLKVATTFSTGVLHGHEGQPLVVGSTMYVVTPYPNLLYAIDLTKPGGVLRWVYAPPTDSRAVGIACCDIINRGAVYADGKIVYSTLDAQTVAVNATTGKEVWRVPLATSTSARPSPARRSW